MWLDNTLSDEELGKLKGNEKNSIIFIKRR